MPFIPTRWQDGDNLVTQRFSYTEYGHYQRSRRQMVVDSMLFDLKMDPGENRNVAGQETYQPSITPLAELLQQILDRQN